MFHRQVFVVTSPASRRFMHQMTQVMGISSNALTRPIVNPAASVARVAHTAVSQGRFTRIKITVFFRRGDIWTNNHLTGNRGHRNYRFRPTTIHGNNSPFHSSQIRPIRLNSPFRRHSSISSNPPQYQQQPPMMPPQPPPVPPKKKPNVALGCGIIIVVLLVCSFGSWFAISSVATKPTVLAPTATSHALPALPTATSALVTPIVTHPIPTTIYETPVLATPTPANSGNASVTYGTPQLGGPISDFTGKYGNPNTTPCPPDNLCWFKDGSSNTEGLVVNKHISTSGSITNQVDWVTVQSINGQIWNSSVAAALCTVYNPIDAHQINRIPLTDSSGQTAGFDIVYLSASLAHKFTQDDFN